MEAFDEKRLNDGCVDRISGLPDEILGEILSRLTTKKAAATCILSTRWRKVFPHKVPLTQIHLDDTELLRGPPRYCKCFANFVSRLFNESLLYGIGVEKVVLHCEKYYDNAEIFSWFGAIVRLNVKKLHLILPYSPRILDGFFSFFNGFGSLVDLEFESEYNLYVPDDIVLPNLKKLSLFTMSLPKNGYSINELIRGCPMLEELSIVEVNFGGMDSIYIQSDLLKKLCIEFCKREDECTVVIDAPNLEYFVYAGSKVANFAIKSFESLHSASLDFDLMGGFSNDSYSREAKIFEECSIANRLCLYGAAVWALDSVPLCTFPNLTSLALRSLGGWYKFEMLAHFLQKAPKLESLKFEKEFDVHARWDVGAFAAFESVLHELPVLETDLHTSVCPFIFLPEIRNIYRMDFTLAVKTSKNDGVDRISGLPDPILSTILSYLPVKNAVAARILSARWRNISPFGVPPINIDFDDSLLLNPNAVQSESLSCSFVDFVDKLLAEALCNRLLLNKFVLKCKEHYEDSKILSWVLAARKLKVQDLDIEVFLDDPLTPKNLFCCLNGSETLLGLEVGKNFDLRILENFTLPNLKRLQVNDLSLSDEETNSINELITGCPLLENLWVESCDLQSLVVLSIQSPLLKNLVIEDSWTNSSCELELDAPNLEMLLYSDCVALGYNVSDFKSLTTVHIDVGPNQELLDEINEYSDDEALFEYDDGVTKLVTACSSTSNLYLASCSIGALLRAEARLPPFQNLTWLALGSLPGLNGWEFLACMLLSAPNLEKLTFEEGFTEYKGGYEKFESLLPKPPICLQMHLKKVEVWAFKGEEDEFKLFDYLLKNGVLQKLKIYDCLPCKDSCFLERLVALTDASETCCVLLGLKTTTTDE
ncbi:unnamed protein product [Cuscuta campestris]|uniref:F-box domain-containing protein n=1 Tax=Cuscuta campestris TaxID=132261 RepID=A0A484MTD9_9ASTE|nr:unnamed protein product [Cuscuta campestris]